MSSAVSELRFQTVSFEEEAAALEGALYIAKVSKNAHETRQAWRRAGQYKHNMGERGAMIAECIACWAGEP